MSSQKALEQFGIRPKSSVDGDGRRLIDGKWWLEGMLGRGAFGEVYKAKDVDNSERVAVKIFDENLTSSGYLRELELMFGVEHPNIVEVRSLGYTSGDKYIVYEYVPGGNLRDYLVRSPRNEPDRALEIVERIARGLEVAHDHRVIHRDLKPENILLTQPEWPFDCKLCDFGLSSRRAPGERMAAMHGSPAYMAPEQFDQDYDHRADLFSLGVICFELLFGHRPFGGDAISISHAHEHLEIQLPSEGPGPVLDLLKQLLAKEPDHRPNSAEQLVEMVQQTRCQLAESASRNLLPPPEPAQWRFREQWQARIGERIEHWSPGRGDGVLLAAGSRIVELTANGELNALARDRNLESLISGGSKQTRVGWERGRPGQICLLADGEVSRWQLDERWTEGPYRLLLSPDGDYLAVIRPEDVSLWTADGRALWRAEVETYGAPPPVVFSSDSRVLWLATESPRTRITAMSIDGERLCRTKGPGSEVDLIGGPDGRVIAASPDSNQLHQVDTDGFVVRDQVFAETMISVQSVGEQVIGVVSSGHIEMFDLVSLEPRGLVEHPNLSERTIYSRRGLFQLTDLPGGTRIRHLEVD